MEVQWPLIIFTFFNCLCGGIMFMQGLLTCMSKGKKMQLVSCVGAIVALAVGGIAVFFHLQHPMRMLNGFGHITSGITIELIFVVVFALVDILYFLMMRRSEEGVAPKWVAVLAMIVSVVLPFVTGDSYLMEAIPVWDTMLLPVYYVVFAIFIGGFASMIIAAATKCDDAIELSAQVAFIGSLVTLVVAVVYAVSISGMTGEYTDMEYYFDPTLPDVAMRSASDVTGAILTGEYAVAFWLGVIVIGCAVPAVVSFLVMRGKIANDKVLVAAIIGIVCVIVGTIIWRVLLYKVAVNALIQFQWALE